MDSQYVNISDFCCNDPNKSTGVSPFFEMPAAGPLVIIYASVSSIMVVFGVAGNGAVIVLISRVLLTSNSKATVYIYILFLSIIDMIYLVTRPFSISYEIVGTWLFDTFICHVNMGAEIINKTLSVYVLVILSGDRYTAICNPLSTERRDVRKASLILAGTTFLVFIGNLPMYIFTKVDPIIETPNLTVIMCKPDFPKFGNSSIWDHTQVYYAIYLEIFYFCIPGFLILTFYSLLLTQLRRREKSKRLQRQLVRRGKVTKSILVVIIFYFGCWTPYWIFQLFAIFAQWPYDSAVVLLVAKVVYLLPLANSALNPILYGVLNQRLRKQYQDSVNRQKTRRINRSQFSKRTRTSFSFQRNDTFMARFFPPNRHGILAEVTECGESEIDDSRRSSIASRLSRFSVGNIFCSTPVGVPNARSMGGFLRVGNSSPTLPSSHCVVNKAPSYPYSIPEEDDSVANADEHQETSNEISGINISCTASDITDTCIDVNDFEHHPLKLCYSDAIRRYSSEDYCRRVSPSSLKDKDSESVPLQKQLQPKMTIIESNQLEVEDFQDFQSDCSDKLIPEKMAAS